MIKQVAASPKQQTLVSTPPLSVFSGPRSPARMPEARFSPHAMTPARLSGEGGLLDGRTSQSSLRYSGSNQRTMDRDWERERADDMEREQKRERLSEREQGRSVSFDTSPSRRDEERGSHLGGGAPKRGRIVIDGMVVDANLLRSALTGGSASGAGGAGLTDGVGKVKVDGSERSNREKTEVQGRGVTSSEEKVGEEVLHITGRDVSNILRTGEGAGSRSTPRELSDPFQHSSDDRRGPQSNEEEATGLRETSVLRSESTARDFDVGHLGSERERGGTGPLGASPRESGSERDIRLAELEREARELQGRLAEKVESDCACVLHVFVCSLVI